MSKKRLFRRILLYVVLLVIVILMIMSIVKSHKVFYTGDIKNVLINTETKNKYKLDEESAITYSEYLKEHKDAKIIDKDIVLTLDETNIEDSNFIKDSNGIYTSDISKINYNFDVLEEGLYSLFLRYTPIIGNEENIPSAVIDHYKSRTSEIERSILINDVIPFKEAENIKVARIWKDAGPIEVSANGDEVRPNQIEEPVSNDVFIGDFTNLHTLSYKFFLKEGNNQKLTLKAIGEPMYIEELKFTKEDAPLEYSKALEKYKAEGYDIYTGKEPIVIQGEKMHYKSSPVLIPLNDNTSRKITPVQKGRATKLNIMGHFSWRMPGYWVEYEFDAPRKGLYALSFHAKQDIKQATFSTREIIINGKIPFMEASHIPFISSNEFNTYVIGSKKDKYLFPLEKGNNTIRMRTSLSNIGDILSLVTDSVDKLNNLYLEVMMSVPEEIDDVNIFNIEIQVKDFKPRVQEIIDNLESLVSHYKQIVKKVRGRLSNIEGLISQLKKFHKYPNGITKELNSFKSNIATLGTWINQETEQPLTVDKFMFHSEKYKVPRVRQNVFETIYHEFVKFLFSFAGNKKGKGTITVWVTSGRDNVHIIRRLLNDPDDGLKDLDINLELVNPNVLLSAATANKSPDIALNVPENIPVDFAFRGVLQDLSKFQGFDTEVFSRYEESAFTTFKYEDGIYAIPETQIFPVMFYRKDIFDKLDSLPYPGENTTYEELENIIETLQNNKMNFYLESPSQAAIGATSNVVTTGLFATLLFQHGGEFYNKELTKTGLLEEESKQAFIQYCDYFSNRGIDIQANFINRFRSGEMPAGIVSYDVYNQFAVFAPEISGKWSVAPVPTFIQKGSPSNFTIHTNIPQSTIMFNKTKNKEKAWQFIKWWTSDKTQLLYGRELETTVGAAARYAAANINTAELIPWPREILNTIQLSRTRTKGIPQVPGGYMTTRQFRNAFLANVRDNKGTVDILYNYAQDIDNEIEKKRSQIR